MAAVAGLATLMADMTETASIRNALPTRGRGARRVCGSVAHQFTEPRAEPP